METKISASVETIVKLAIMNGQEHLITRAIVIDSGIDCDEMGVPEYLPVEISRELLPKGKMFDGNKTWGYVNCLVIKKDIYKLTDDYLVLLPNESTRWVSYSEIQLTKIVDTTKDDE